jgi:hypothetical protein
LLRRGREGGSTGKGFHQEGRQAWLIIKKECGSNQVGRQKKDRKGHEVE